MYFRGSEEGVVKGEDLHWSHYQCLTGPWFGLVCVPVLVIGLIGLMVFVDRWTNANDRDELNTSESCTEE